MKKLYSFDLFDTLVERTVRHPKDVFILVDATGIVKYRFFLNIFFTFKSIRVFSEKLIRFLNKRNREDISIFDIYRFLNFFIKNPKEVLLKEVELELFLIKPKLNNIEMLNDLIIKGENVCITSDMYLSKNMIKKILKKNGIKVDVIYVSSCLGLTKVSGNMFRYISTINGVEFGNIYHYGDNILSDIYSPESLGINTIHLEANNRNESECFFDCFIAPNQDDVYYKIGYEFCGKLAYLFSFYIKNNIKNRNANIVFGARDSYLFKYAFDKFFNHDDFYKTYYTRISRNLVYLPEVFFSNDFKKLFIDSSSCNVFFEGVGLSCPPHLKGKSSLIHKKEIEEILRNNENFMHYLYNNASIVKEYLSQNGFDKDVYFVDLGWRGSIQDSLNVIFDKLNIIGLYIGVTNNNKDKKGFLFSGSKGCDNFFYIYQCVAFFEFLFTEPELSLSGIKHTDEGFSYIFTNDENIAQVNFRNKIELGAKQFFTDYYEISKLFNFNEKFIFNSVKPLIFNSTMKINDNFLPSFIKLSHSSGYNGSNKSNILEFNTFSFIDYLRSPWKAYFMYELKKYSIWKYYFFMIFFHNKFFYYTYSTIKKNYHKLRERIYG